MHPRRDLDAHKPAVDRWDLDRPAECRERHRHGHPAGQIVAIALEEFVRRDIEKDVEIAGFTASIRVNTQKGMRVFKAPYAVQDWSAVDTTGMLATWKEVHDSDTSWSHGALNDGLTADPHWLRWLGRDGVHLNGEGHARVYELVRSWPALLRWAGLETQRLATPALHA